MLGLVVEQLEKGTVQRVAPLPLPLRCDTKIKCLKRGTGTRKIGENTRLCVNGTQLKIFDLFQKKGLL